MKYNTEAIEVLEPAVSAAVASIRKLPKRVHREGLSVKKHTDRKVAGLALQITETEDRMTTLIAGVDDRMDLMEDRMGKMEDRMGKMEDRMEKIEDRMEKMEDRMEKMEDRMGKMEVRMKNVEESLNNKLDTTTFLENMNAITAMLGELGSPSARARGMLSLTTLPRLRTEVTPNPGLLSPDALLSPHRSPTTSDPPSPSSPSASRPLRRKKSFIEKAVNFITRRVTANVSANYQPPPGFEDQLARELNEAITFVEVHGPPEPDTEALPPVPPLPASVSRDNLVVGSRRGPQSPTTAKGKGKGKEHER
ncbi:hypothetical protein C2E23DRAFT_621158 [Lenzites betulinus]|nr:hypothetical protein C2E23DRAFT_621158 [Lenzites betulinus]